MEFWPETFSPDKVQEYRNQRILCRNGPLPPGRSCAYDSAYGDLCFLDGSDRLIRRRLKMENSYPEPQAESLPTNESFQFFFMNLPREIRDQIYKVLIKPMWDGSKSKPETSGFDGVHLGVWTPEKKPIRYAHYPPKPAGLEDEASQRLRLRHRPYESPPREKHPCRLYNYDVSTYYCPYQIRDDIRNLSNTNSIIRQELAQVIFARTCISDLKPYNSTVFQQFLIDRPAVWAGIKKITLELTFHQRCGQEVGGNQPAKFSELLRLLSTILQLESLKIRFVMHEYQFDAFLGSETKPDWVSTIRNFPISNSFELELVPLPDFDEDWDNEEVINALRTKYEAWIKEMIFPNSLRLKSKDDLSIVERYMAQRV